MTDESNKNQKSRNPIKDNNNPEAVADNNKDRNNPETVNETGKDRIKSAEKTGDKKEPKTQNNENKPRSASSGPTTTKLKWVFRAVLLLLVLGAIKLSLGVYYCFFTPYDSSFGRNVFLNWRIKNVNKHYQSKWTYLKPSGYDDTSFNGEMGIFMKKAQPDITEEKKKELLKEEEDRNKEKKKIEKSTASKEDKKKQIEDLEGCAKYKSNVDLDCGLFYDGIPYQFIYDKKQLYFFLMTDFEEKEFIKFNKLIRSFFGYDPVSDYQEFLKTGERKENRPAKFKQGKSLTKEESKKFKINPSKYTDFYETNIIPALKDKSFERVKKFLNAVNALFECIENKITFKEEDSNLIVKATKKIAKILYPKDEYFLNKRFKINKNKKVLENSTNLKLKVIEFYKKGGLAAWFPENSYFFSMLFSAVRNLTYDVKLAAVDKKLEKKIGDNSRRIVDGFCHFFAQLYPKSDLSKVATGFYWFGPSSVEFDEKLNEVHEKDGKEVMKLFFQRIREINQ